MKYTNYIAAVLALICIIYLIWRVLYLCVVNGCWWDLAALIAALFFARLTKFAAVQYEEQRNNPKGNLQQ